MINYHAFAACLGSRESGKQQHNADPLKITNALVKVQYNLLYYQ